MKYKCLVFDHDDTVVNSTASIHHPSFQDFLDIRFPGRSISLEDYMRKNFDPGFFNMCIRDFGMSQEDLELETEFWRDYVSKHVPSAYPGIKELMERHRSQGGLICVSSWSYRENILRDYEFNSLPVPDAVFGWELPLEDRKPSPYSLNEIMRWFELSPSDILMIDDLKPGYDMAAVAGADFAGAGWSYDIPEIEAFMRSNCAFYFKTVAEFAEFLN